MELYSYVPGVLPKTHILFERTDASLALVFGREANAARCFDIFARNRIDLDPAWLSDEFHIDVELSDLIIDLNLAGFRTSGCCRGKYRSDEQAHLDASYIAFKEYLPSDLSTALTDVGLRCMTVSAGALLANPQAFLNWRSRIGSWIRNGSLPRVPPTAEQIALNTAFPQTIRQVFGMRVASVSQDIYRLGAALQ